jgi:hypothetical protein
MFVQSIAWSGGKVKTRRSPQPPRPDEPGKPPALLTESLFVRYIAGNRIAADRQKIVQSTRNPAFFGKEHT